MLEIHRFTAFKGKLSIICGKGVAIEQLTLAIINPTVPKQREVLPYRSTSLVWTSSP
jgi:hypothetical protein